MRRLWRRPRAHHHSRSRAGPLAPFRMMRMHTEPDPSTCPECGAPRVEGLTCWEQLGMEIAWEADDPELLAEHFFTVATYNLQHPAQFTDDAIEGLRQASVDRLTASRSRRYARGSGARPPAARACSGPRRRGAPSCAAGAAPSPTSTSRTSRGAPPSACASGPPPCAGRRRSPEAHRKAAQKAPAGSPRAGRSFSIRSVSEPWMPSG